jgi:hypothetical protein
MACSRVKDLALPFDHLVGAGEQPSPALREH